MQKTIRKPISILLSVLLVFSLAVGAMLPVFAEGDDPEANWVQVPTSSEGLSEGDYWFDLSGLDAYKEIFANESVYDLIPENNEYRVGVTYLKDTYPEDWAAAIEEFKSRNPGFDDYDFNAENGGWPMYDTEDIFFEALSAKGVDVSYSAIEKLGEAYLGEKYPDEVAAANAEAQAYIDELKSLDWFVDFNFSGFDWIKAEQNGAPYEGHVGQEIISECFTVYGANWEKVAVVDSADELTTCGYVLDKAVLEAVVKEMILRIVGDVEVIGTVDYETGEMKEIPIAEYIAQQVELYTDIEINTTAGEDNLFRYKVNTEQSLYPGGPTTTLSIVYPLADHTWASTPFTAAFFAENVQFVHVNNEPTWQWESETQARAIFVCKDGDRKISVTATGDEITAEVIKEATAAEDGLIRYTATVEFEGKTYTDTYDKIIPATGTPDEPDTPASGSTCPYCGEKHDRKTISGWWTELIHHILYVLNQVFFWWNA